MARAFSMGTLWLAGCAGFGAPPAVVWQTLDYRIDRPRVLAMAATPPDMSSGVGVTLEALVLGPGGAQATSGRWATCGLRTDSDTVVEGLDCFAESAEVIEMAQGLPASWTVPDLSSGCARDAGCYADVPVLLETTMGGDVVRGTFQAFIGGTPSLAEGLRASTLTLDAGAPQDGVVVLEGWTSRDLGAADFRWYVDDGDLLDTGRTAITGHRDGGARTANRWRLPAVAGAYRAVLVLSSSDIGWSHDTALPGFATSADMTWAVVEVVVP